MSAKRPKPLPALPPEPTGHGAGLRLPGPRNGWRAFLGEVGIIVLGVLIALGAEQLVQNLNRQADLRELRAALDDEVAYGLETYAYRTAQDRCLDARLTELEAWLESARSGRPRQLVGEISAPHSAPAGTSVWDSADPNVVAFMPMRTKLAYAAIYDEFANNEVQRLDERMTWLQLAEFDGATELDHHDQMRLRGLITRARWRARNFTDNTQDITDIARPIGIRKGENQQAFLTPATFAALCKPILARGEVR
jgi:hypothetical protein